MNMAIWICIAMLCLFLWGVRRNYRAHPSDGDLSGGCMLLACLVGATLSALAFLVLCGVAAFR